MYEFLKGQMDYIYFFNCLACIILAAVCFIADKTGFRRLPWAWLALFSVAMGVHQWLELMAYSLGGDHVLQAVRAGVAVVSFLILAEFGRSGIITLQGKGPGWWVYVPLLALVSAGGLAGIAGLNAAARYVLAAVGGIWAARALAKASRARNDCRNNRGAAGGAAMALYTLVICLVVPAAPFFPASLINQDIFFQRLGFPVQIVQGLFILALAVTLRRSLYFFSREEAEGRTGQNRFRRRGHGPE